MRRISIVAAGALVVVIVAAVAGAVRARDARANDIASFQTVFATDMASAGYGGMRGLGTGTITLSGVSGTVTKAFLYWHGPTNSTDPAVNAAVTFAGTPITGTNIGLSSDNCWAFTNSQGYRADVTSLVTGNGAYSLANFTKASAEINGASLIVFFNDGNAANNRDVVIFDGNDSNKSNIYDADGWNVTLSGINYTSGTANIVLHVSDGQTPGEAALMLGAATLAPAGPIFGGDTVPNGAGGPSNGGLWDIRSFDVTSSLSPGPNTLSLTMDTSSNDCLSMIVAAVDLPAGAAPGQPTPETAPTQEVPPTQVRLKTHTPPWTPTAEPTSTPTPVTPTNTPTATATPQPETGRAGVISAPDTGSGPAGGSSRWTWLFGAAMLAVAGGVAMSMGRGVRR